MVEGQRVNDAFRTRDLYFAAALVTAGCRMLRVVPDGDNGRMAWVFKADEPLAQLIDEYWTRQLEVDALTLGEQIRNLKAQIFAVRR